MLCFLKNLYTSKLNKEHFLLFRHKQMTYRRFRVILSCCFTVTEKERGNVTRGINVIRVLELKTGSEIEPCTKRIPDMPSSLVSKNPCCGIWKHPTGFDLENPQTAEGGNINTAGPSKHLNIFRSIHRKFCIYSLANKCASY